MNLERSFKMPSFKHYYTSNMKKLLLAAFIVTGCSTAQKENNNSLPIEGTWKLLSGTLIEKGDTVVTDYSKGLSFIKIINGSHFSFTSHDLNHGKDSTASF